MTTLLQLGETGQAVVGASAIAANTLVKFHTDGTLIVCAGSGDRAIGSVQDAYAIGALATYYKCRGNTHHITHFSAVAAGDLVKTYAGGLVVPESSPAVATAATVGQAITASASDNTIEVVLF